MGEGGPEDTGNSEKRKLTVAELIALSKEREQVQIDDDPSTDRVPLEVANRRKTLEEKRQQDLKNVFLSEAIVNDPLIKGLKQKIILVLNSPIERGDRDVQLASLEEQVWELVPEGTYSREDFHELVGMLIDRLKEEKATHESGEGLFQE